MPTTVTDDLDPDVRAHLLNVARCPIVEAEFAGDVTPCSTIVDFQRERVDWFQVPTPWIGRIDEAPILFVGANPNIGFSENQVYPTRGAGDEALVDWFHFAYEGDPAPIKHGTKELRAGGEYGRTVRNWSEVKGRARELFGRDPRPGVDFAITEAVRCRSQREVGVWEALPTCAGRYLATTLSLSPARVIVLMGKSADRAFGHAYEVPAGNLAGPIEIAGRDRYVARLPHTNARQPRTFAKVLEADQLDALREFIAA